MDGCTRTEGRSSSTGSAPSAPHRESGGPSFKSPDLVQRAGQSKETRMDFKPVDADNHYYEPLDAFTRHLDRKFAWRGVRPVQDGKHVQILIGGRVNRFVPNPSF